MTRRILRVLLTSMTLSPHDGKSLVSSLQSRVLGYQQFNCTITHFLITQSSDGQITQFSVPRRLRGEFTPTFRQNRENAIAFSSQSGDRCLHPLPAADRPLPADWPGEAPRLHELGILGQTCAWLWGSKSSRADPGACTWRAWLQSHWPSFYW